MARSRQCMLWSLSEQGIHPPKGYEILVLALNISDPAVHSVEIEVRWLQGTYHRSFDAALPHHL